MPDSPTLNAEHGVQPRFIFAEFLAALLLVSAIAGFDRWLGRLPNRSELGPQIAEVAATPIELPKRSAGALRLSGAWKLTSGDARFGGVSALAFDAGSLIALTDSGAVIRMPRPTVQQISATIKELPSGPGDGAFKRNRDSEALARDPTGRGWWVAFENRDELWLYDPNFSRALQRVDLGAIGLGENSGIEGAASSGQRLLLFPENGRFVLRIEDGRDRRLPLAGTRGRISEALVSGGRLFAIERRLTIVGFRNALLILERRGRGYRVLQRHPLPLSPTDNVEALAAEPRSGGALRLWLMTDNNYHAAVPTKLIAVDLPGQAANGSAKSSR